MAVLYRRPSRASGAADGGRGKGQAGVNRDEDWGLVERVGAGDDRAFDVLMERYKRPILSFVYRMLGDPTEAEDVAQDVFVRAYRAMAGARLRRTEAAFSTWLFQVARRAALDERRRRWRHPAEPLCVLDERDDLIDGGGRTAAEEAGAREMGRRIAEAVARLPEDQRAAIVLAEYEGMSVRQIAAIMSCSGKSVEARLYRARRFLRKRLAPLAGAAG